MEIRGYELPEKVFAPSIEKKCVNALEEETGFVHGKPYVHIEALGNDFNLCHECYEDMPELVRYVVEFF